MAVSFGWSNAFPPRYATIAALGVGRRFVISISQNDSREKRFRATDVDVASQALWSAVHGITALLIARPTFPWANRDAVIRRVIDSAVDGLLARR